MFFFLGGGGGGVGENCLMNNAMLKHIMGKLFKLNFRKVSFWTWVSKLGGYNKKLVDIEINFVDKSLILV